MEIKGSQAYDTFRWEQGLHKAQRKPKMKQDKKLPTVEAMVEVKVMSFMVTVILKFVHPDL
jgi:protein subunit release factor A